MENSPVAEVLLTEKIKRWIRTALTTTDLPNDTRERLRHFTSNRRHVDDKKPKTIPFQLVKEVHRCIQSEKGTVLYIPVVPLSSPHAKYFGTQMLNRVSIVRFVTIIHS